MRNKNTNDYKYDVIDLGYGFLKIPDPQKKGEVIKIKAVIAKLGESLDGNSSADVIEVDGVEYVVGSDVYALNQKPITANDNEKRPELLAYKVLTLFGLAKFSITTDVKKRFLTGLPYQNLDEADIIKKNFQKVHEIKLNGKEITLDIDEALVTSQGLGTLHTLVAQRGSVVFSKKIIIVDLGFRTVNYVTLINGLIDKDTVKTNPDLGIQAAYKKIVNAVNIEFKKNFKFYDVDDLLDKGVPVQDKETGLKYERINERPYVIEALTVYAQDVWADFIDKYDDKYREGLDEVVFGGGTAERVNDYLNQYKQHFCSKLDNPQDAQVLGYQEIALKLEAAKASAATSE
ncbi:ParM/StbA family protein [Paenibacillus polymyxa]|uniref:ParM/StbA family protein n=1 Tax=Paenibacillus polymyxa TaxID=1406 RepID=UPI00111B94A8|nr:ParM/StbA family protein [Paenibacillus polymyxa]QDA30240.1 ParM/StbA family protein [Paenibacillus polymyxa]